MEIFIIGSNVTINNGDVTGQGSVKVEDRVGCDVETASSNISCGSGNTSDKSIGIVEEDKIDMTHFTSTFGEVPTIYRKSLVSELSFFQGIGGARDSLQFKPNKELLECQFSEKLIGEALSIFDQFSIISAGDDEFEISVLFKERIIKFSVKRRFSCFHMMMILSVAIEGIEKFTRK